MKKLLIFILSVMAGILLISCDSTNPDIDEDLNSDIPKSPTNVTFPAAEYNNINAAASISVSSKNSKRMQLNILELRHPLSNIPIELNYNSTAPAQSNVFIAEDGKIKGLKITKADPSTVKTIDLVFTVDNSQSMVQENDVIVANIIEYGNFLLNSGLDVRFGVVGYVARISGAINLTDLNSISKFLTKGWGVERTKGFGGPDSSDLHNYSTSFAGGADAPIGHNGIVGILFADTYFHWRQNASRVFINFTDDGIHSNGKKWNINHLCNTIAGRATVHSVFSKDTSLIAWSKFIERPWEMSKCTGGDALFVNPGQNIYNLAALPVTQVLSNSYMIEFKKEDEDLRDRIIELFIRTTGADGYKQFNVNY